VYCAARLVYTEAHVSACISTGAQKSRVAEDSHSATSEKRVLRMDTIIQLLIALGILKINPTPDSLVPPVKPQ
jgi:hypothetical protein